MNREIFTKLFEELADEELENYIDYDHEKIEGDGIVIKRYEADEHLIYDLESNLYFTYYKHIGRDLHTNIKDRADMYRLIKNIEKCYKEETEDKSKEDILERLRIMLNKKKISDYHFDGYYCGNNKHQILVDITLNKGIEEED